MNNAAWYRERVLRNAVAVSVTLGSIAGFRTSASTLGPEPQEDPRIENALRCLRDPDWADTDPEIQRRKEMNARSGRLEGGNIDAIIARREVSAMSAVLSAESLSDPEINTILRECTSHRNQEVRDIAAGQLVSRQLWTSQEAMSYAQNAGRLGAWNAVLPALRRVKPVDEVRPVARAAMQALLKSHNPSDPGQVALVNESVRALAASTNPGDYQMLEELVTVFPDQPLLWLALARNEASERTTSLAHEVYDDQQRSNTLRCAAGLVWSQQAPSVATDVYDRILNYAREFGSRAYGEQLKDCYANLLDPKCREMLAGSKDGEGLVGVLLELPAPIVRSHVRELCQYHTGTAGLSVCAALAIRFPAEFLDIAEEYANGSGEIQRGLLLLGLRYPEFKERAERLIPPEALAELRREVAASGVSCLAPTLPNSSLLDLHPVE